MAINTNTSNDNTRRPSRKARPQNRIIGQARLARLQNKLRGEYKLYVWHDVKHPHGMNGVVWTVAETYGEAIETVRGEYGFDRNDWIGRVAIYRESALDIMQAYLLGSEVLGSTERPGHMAGHRLAWPIQACRIRGNKVYGSVNHRNHAHS